MVYQKVVKGNTTLTLGSELSAGVYIVKVSSASESKTVKLVRID